jgi:hypothetical protein
MSQENVEVVVSALEKWNPGDDTGALESFAADVEIHHNIVLVLGTLRLRGTGSGAVADTPFGLVTEFEHGVGTRQFVWTGDQSKALEAVGLRE